MSWFYLGLGRVTSGLTGAETEREPSVIDRSFQMPIT